MLIFLNNTSKKVQIVLVRKNNLKKKLHFLHQYISISHIHLMINIKMEKKNIVSKVTTPSSFVCVVPFWQPWHCWQVWAQNCLWSLAAHLRLGCQWHQPLSVLSLDAEAALLYAWSDVNGVSPGSQHSYGLLVQLEAVIKQYIITIILSNIFS